MRKLLSVFFIFSLALMGFQISSVGAQNGSMGSHGSQGSHGSMFTTIPKD